MTRTYSRSAPLIRTIDFTGFSIVMAMIVFTVLVIFMMVPPPHHGVSFDLPRAHNSVAMRRADRWDAMVVSITRDGKVAFGSERVRPDMLPKLIRKSLTGGAERKVYMKVDRYAQYGVVLLVLGEVRSAGIENVAFLVEEMPPAPNSGP